MDALLKATLVNWATMPLNTFIKVEGNLFVIKFRDTLVSKKCFNKVNFTQGLSFIDVQTTDDYFLGEFIVVDDKTWDIKLSHKSIVLLRKFKYTVKHTTKLRDDGFLKIYRTTRNALVICCI